MFSLKMNTILNYIRNKISFRTKSQQWNDVLQSVFRQDASTQREDNACAAGKFTTFERSEEEKLNEVPSRNICTTIFEREVEPLEEEMKCLSGDLNKKSSTEGEKEEAHEEPVKELKRTWIDDDEEYVRGLDPMELKYYLELQELLTSCYDTPLLPCIPPNENDMTNIKTSSVHKLHSNRKGPSRNLNWLRRKCNNIIKRNE